MGILLKNGMRSVKGKLTNLSLLEVGPTLFSFVNLGSFAPYLGPRTSGKGFLKDVYTASVALLFDGGLHFCWLHFQCA